MVPYGRISFTMHRDSNPMKKEAQTYAQTGVKIRMRYLVTSFSHEGSQTG